MYNTLDSVFSDAMKREGKTIYAYADNTPYTVVFRRNSDTNKLQDTITIYYSAECGIRSGQLLTYKGNTYLTINSESAENDVYRKSDLLQTNAVLSFITGGIQYHVPAYAKDVQSALTVSDSIISIVGGNVEIIADTTSDIKRLQNGDNFYALGGYWQIDNLIYKDDVVHIYVERSTTNATYTVTITGDASYYRGTAAKLTAVAMYNSSTVSNADITWATSDSNIATVDSSGNVSFISDGLVTISATWAEHSATGSLQVTVTEPPVYSLAINAENSYITTDTPTLTATAMINGTADDTATITWISSNESIATIDSTGKLIPLAEGSVTITATWMEQNITAQKDISVSVPVSSYLYTCKITNTITAWTEYNDTTNIASIKSGGTLKPFMCHFYDASNAEVTLTPAWSVDLSSLTTAQQAKVHLTYNASYPLRAYLNADSDNTLIGTQVRLVLTDSTGKCAAHSIPVNITSLT